ncbi:hypothetical protein ACFQX6_15580 [Streptosporangium lutulentum]
MGEEVARACARYGGGVRHSAPGGTGDRDTHGDRTGEPFDLVFALSAAGPLRPSSRRSRPSSGGAADPANPAAARSVTRGS